MIARPLMTTFGGTCCRPSALRSRPSTTTILVNEVTITATNGAIASPTTVVTTSAGLKLLKSIGVPAFQLYAQRVADRDEAAMPHAVAVGADADPCMRDVVGQGEHVAGREARQLRQRDVDLAEAEVDAQRQLCERIAAACTAFRGGLVVLFSRGLRGRSVVPHRLVHRIAPEFVHRRRGGRVDVRR